MIKKEYVPIVLWVLWIFAGTLWYSLYEGHPASVALYQVLLSHPAATAKCNYDLIVLLTLTLFLEHVGGLGTGLESPFRHTAYL